MMSKDDIISNIIYWTMLMVKPIKNDCDIKIEYNSSWLYINILSSDSTYLNSNSLDISLHQIRNVLDGFINNTLIEYKVNIFENKLIFEIKIL